MRQPCLLSVFGSIYLTRPGFFGFLGGFFPKKLPKWGVGRSPAYIACSSCRGAACGRGAHRKRFTGAYAHRDPGSVLNNFDSADLLLNSRAVVHVCGNSSYLVDNFDTVRYPAESGILTVEKISVGVHDEELA